MINSLILVRQFTQVLILNALTQIFVIYIGNSREVNPGRRCA